MHYSYYLIVESKLCWRPPSWSNIVVNCQVWKEPVTNHSSMFKVYLSYKYLLTKDNAGEKAWLYLATFCFYEKHMLYRWVYNTWALLSGKKSMQKGRVDCHHSYTKRNRGVRKNRSFIHSKVKHLIVQPISLISDRFLCFGLNPQKTRD